jgi:hypothetical protein
MELCRSISLVFFIVSASSAFELIKVEPKSTTIPNGGKLRLTCNTDGVFEWCKFIHNNKFCDFEWVKSTWNITMKECSHFDDRIRFFGDYNKYECGIELDNVTEEGKTRSV